MKYHLTLLKYSSPPNVNDKYTGNSTYCFKFAGLEYPAQKTAVYKEGGVTRLREVQNFKLGFAT